MMRKMVFAIGLLGIMAKAVSGQESPCVYPRMDKVDAHVRAEVSQSPGGLDYHYLVVNRSGALQILDSFGIQAFTVGPPSRATPPDWTAGGPILGSAFYTWYMLGGSRGLAPGASAAGFGFANADLPAIVTFLAWGEVEPPSFPLGEAPSSCENADVIQNSFKGTTVGPKPPPQPFVPLEFLNYLLTLLHDSRQLGWITGDGVHQSLLAKLINAKRKLEAGEGAVAKNILNAFLNEVRAASCPEFTCPGNKPLTSEAYALLYFNGQYLWERLP
jgi:hypothetical protein